MLLDLGSKELSIRRLLEWQNGALPDALAASAPLLLSFCSRTRQLSTWHSETGELLRRCILPSPPPPSRSVVSDSIGIDDVLVASAALGGAALADEIDDEEENQRPVPLLAVRGS